jgi:hypothetical protein
MTSTADNTGQNRGLANLIVQTSVINNCEPQSLCDYIKDKDLLLNVSTFEDNALKYEIPLLPGNDQGWTVNLFPDKDGMQYDVSQENNIELADLISLNTNFSDDCHGIIEQGEVRKCIINNEIIGNNVPAKLTIITEVENKCLPANQCTQIREDDFLTTISVFEHNSLSQRINDIPGDNQGWIVYLLPERFSATQWPPQGEGIQFKVEQKVGDVSGFEGIITNSTYSQDCRSIIDRGESKYCTVTNSLFINNSD